MGPWGRILDSRCVRVALGRGLVGQPMLRHAHGEAAGDGEEPETPWEGAKPASHPLSVPPHLYEGDNHGLCPPHRALQAD